MEEQPGKVKQAEVVPTADDRDGDAGGWWTRPQDSVRAVLDGLTFGAADELGAGIAASFAVMLDGADYMDTYNDMMGVLQDERADYAQDHPVANIGLNIVGGILSPANVLGAAAITGKAASTAGGIAKPLTSAAQKIAAKTGTTAGQGKLATAGRAAVVAGGEGAVAGALSSEQGNRTRGAAEGVLFGVGTSGAISTVGQAIRIPFSRKVDAPLKVVNPATGKLEHVPMNLAAKAGDSTFENVLQLFYQRAVGGAWVSSGMIRKQSQPWLDNAVLAADKVADKLKQAQARTNVAIQRLKRIKQENVDASIATNKEVSAGRMSRLEEDVLAREANDAAQKAQHDAQLGREAQDILADAQQGFRQQISQDALPSGSKKKIRDKVANLMSRDALEIIRREFLENGFKMVKRRKFRVPKSFGNRVKADVLEDTVLIGDDKLELTNFIDSIDAELNNIREAGDLGSKSIKGTDLLNLRTKAADAASSIGNDATGVDAMKQKAYRAVVKQIDNMFETQLTGKAKEDFIKDKTAWANKTAMENAIARANKDKGQFTTDQWLDAIKQTARRESNIGNAPNQKLAEEMSDSAKEGQKALEELYTNIQQNLAKESARIIGRIKNSMIAERDTLAERVGELKKVRNRVSEQVTRMGQDRPNHQRLTEEIELLEGVVKDLKDSIPAERMSLFERNFAAVFTGAILQAVVGSALTLGSTLMTGVVFAPVLARELSQQIIAGQTWGQGIADAFLSGLYDGNRRISRAAQRGVQNQINSSGAGPSLYERGGA